MENNNRNNVWPIALAVIITAVVVGSGMYWAQNLKTESMKDVSKISDSQFAKKVAEPDSLMAQQEAMIPPAKLVDTATSGTSIEQNYSLRPGDLAGFTAVDQGNLIFMEKKAIAKLYGNEETITSFYTPESPANSDIIFISTSGAKTGEWPEMKSANKIYSYNIKTGEITLLYTEYENRLLRTMGVDGSKLILMYDGIDNSPGPCFSVWAEWEDFGYLELADINGGLSPYTAPAYQVQKGKEEQKKCMAEL